MIDRLRLLALLNVGCCPDCISERIDDVCSGLESGDIVAGTDQDAIIGLWMTASGASLLRQVPMMPDAIA